LYKKIEHYMYEVHKTNVSVSRESRYFFVGFLFLFDRLGVLSASTTLPALFLFGVLLGGSLTGWMTGNCADSSKPVWPGLKKIGGPGGS